MCIYRGGEDVKQWGKVYSTAGRGTVEARDSQVCVAVNDYCRKCLPKQLEEARACW